MGYFNRDTSNRSGRDNRGGGRGFGGGRDRGGRDSRPSFRDDKPREMFKTFCSNCGKECEVPFRPTMGKPVYCSDCFEKMGGRNSDSGRTERNDRPERRDRPSFDRHQTFSPTTDNSKQLNELNAKLDKIIDLLSLKKEKVAAEEVKSNVVNDEFKIAKTAKIAKPKKAKSVKEETAAI